MEYLPDYLADRQQRVLFGNDRTFDVIRLLELNTAAAYHLAVTSNAQLADWMARVDTGDLVVEVTTLMTPAYDGQRLGVVDHLHRDMAGEPTALLLRTLDGSQRVWDKGRFVRVIDRVEVFDR